MSPNIIEVNDVSVWFGDFNAVSDLSFSISEGSRVAILGRTGAGKSTLLNLLVGNLEPTSGTVRVAGHDPVRERRELQGLLSMAYQSPRLLPWRTARENVEVGMEILRVPKAERRERAEHWLRMVHLDNAGDRYPAQLSGGMRQRTSLARAFAIGPRLIFLDESFSALDEVTAKGLRADFVTMSEESSVSAVIVTHSIEEAFEIADRVLVFGRPARILGDFDAAEVRRKHGDNFLPFREHIHQMMVDAEKADAEAEAKSLVES
ncbi:ATP-binding cassette domain-containing protein [Nocardiopsis sp. ATB16-24]|uniref:ABC transporter ATP-binding protein n=1 Tax=Nocardiopsis sp. ATB16-24 TaxID=3019555 RepID=UPI0025562047|nr:ATP-binding cassette domain-containing protein [Nocardiopsis sp. ATB16-24]